jgi:hypothetical protein
MNPPPTSREAWPNEIGRALRDAPEAIPFAPLAGASFEAANRCSPFGFHRHDYSAIEDRIEHNPRSNTQTGRSWITTG